MSLIRKKVFSIIFPNSNDQKSYMSFLPFVLLSGLLTIGVFSVLILINTSADIRNEAYMVDFPVISNTATPFPQCSNKCEYNSYIQSWILYQCLGESTKSVNCPNGCNSSATGCIENRATAVPTASPIKLTPTKLPTRMLVQATPTKLPTTTPILIVPQVCTSFGGVREQACVDRHTMRYYCAQNNKTEDLACPDTTYCRNGKCIISEANTPVSSPTQTQQTQLPTQQLSGSACLNSGGVAAVACVDRHTLRSSCANGTVEDKPCSKQQYCANGACRASNVAEEPEERINGTREGICYCVESVRGLTYVCENQTLCCVINSFTQTAKGKQVCSSGPTPTSQQDSSLSGLYLQTDKDLIGVNVDFTYHGCGPTSLYNACKLSGKTNCNIEQIAIQAGLSDKGTHLTTLMQISNQLIGPSDYLFSVETKEGARYAQTIDQTMNKLDPQVSADMQKATEAGNILLATLKVTQPDGRLVDHIVLINHCDANGCTGIDSYYNQDRTVNYTGQVYPINFSEWGSQASLEQVVVIQTL